MFSMPIAGDDPVLLLGLSAFALLLVALPWGFWALSSGKTSSGVRVLIALANLALTAQLVLRWWQSGHFPISNLYESLCFWPGLHPHPAFGGAQLAVSACGCSRHTHGSGMCGFRQFCPP